MGGKASTPAATVPEPPAPFALPCLPHEFISGDSLFLSEDYVPYPAILEHKCIVVRIVSVTDGDTFRGRHIPNGHKLYPYPLVKKHQRTELFAQCQAWEGKLKGETLRLRIYAVDAPELAKMGRPGQHYAEEATQFMKQRLLNRIVFVRLLAKDQYGRLIVQILVPCSSLGKQASLKSVTSMKSISKDQKSVWSLLRCCIGGSSSRALSKKERCQWCEDVSQSLLLAGLATIYTGQNAQYNGNIERLEQLLREACDKKVGMFSPEGPAPESPASFKRRLRDELLEAPSGVMDSTLADEESPARARGRLLERETRNIQGSNSPRKGRSPTAAHKTALEVNAQVEEGEMKNRRAKPRQRRRRKSRSRSARRRRAAERAAGSAGASAALEVSAVAAPGAPPALAVSSKSGSGLQSETPNNNTRPGNRKGLHVRGISGSDPSRPLHTNTLTFSVDESPAMTGSRRGHYGDQTAFASMSTNSLRNGHLGSDMNSSRLYLQAEVEPLVELDEVTSPELEEVSGSDYENYEEGEEGGEEDLEEAEYEDENRRY